MSCLFVCRTYHVYVYVVARTPCKTLYDIPDTPICTNTCSVTMSHYDALVLIGILGISYKVLQEVRVTT